VSENADSLKHSAPDMCTVSYVLSDDNLNFFHNPENGIKIDLKPFLSSDEFENRTLYAYVRRFCAR